MRVSTNPRKRVVPYSAFAVGLLVLLIGVQGLLSDIPDCGGQYMEPTDSCYETAVGPGGPSGGSYTAEQELQGTHNWGIAGIVVGSLIMICAAVVICRRRARQPRNTVRAATSGSTITSRRVRAEADRHGLRVDRFDSSRARWEPHVKLRWTDIQRLSFAADPHDPVVGFYAVTVSGRRYLFDSAHLNDREWTELAANIAAGSGGRVTLDPAARSRV